MTRDRKNKTLNKSRSERIREAGAKGLYRGFRVGRKYCERDMYEERFYRSITKPRDLHCYEVKLKETDLYCCTTVNLHKRITDRVFFYRNQLEEYIRKEPFFRESLRPVKEDFFAPAMVQEMIRVSGTLGIGPMATVAGAVAEFVGRDIEDLTDEYIIENGGDICLRTKKDRTILLYARNSPYSGKMGLNLPGREQAYGVCTSSATVGPSLSLGIADAVCIVGNSALFADGLATYVGNIVKKKDDIRLAIEKGKEFPGVIGIIIILGEHFGAWGDLKIIKV